MRRILIIVLVLLIPVIPVVLVVTGVLKQKSPAVKRVTLTMWGTADPGTAFASTIAHYNQARPFVTIVYKKVRPEDYLDQLISAWAQGKGPDLFFVPHEAIGKMTAYAAPMPANLSVPQVRTINGLLGKRTETLTPSLRAPTMVALRDQYVDAVTADIIRDGQVWGLPLSMDTIVLYYNKDLLSNAKIFEPARTWNELVTQIDSNRLTVTDENNDIVQAGVALGSAANVPYATDLLSLLMIQNGSTMVAANRKVTLGQAEGQTATEFFTSFANPKKITYSWNASQPNAREAFLQGKVAYFFGTMSDREALEGSNVRWGVAPMLHLSDNGDLDGATKQQRFIDAARYDVVMVSRASQLQRRSTYAWNFLYNMARAQNINLYLKSTGRLSALKSVLAKQKDDPKLGLYAKQLLTARSWYFGRDSAAVERYFTDLITAVTVNHTDVPTALSLTAQQVQSTL